MNSKYISDYVYLAEAGYADFSKRYSEQQVFNAISEAKNQNDIGKPEQFADLVTQNL